MENRMLNFESNYQMCSKETAQMERIKSSDNIFQKEIHQINMKLNNLNREYEIVASSIKDKSKCIDENRKHVDEMVEDIDYLKSHLIQKSVPIERKKNPVDSPEKWYIYYVHLHMPYIIYMHIGINIDVYIHINIYIYNLYM